MKRIVGLDLGSKISYCEVRDGQVVERVTAQGLSGLVRQLGPNTKPAKVAFEACREAWAIYDQLRAWGHEPLMLDTTQVKQIGVGQHRRKTDRIDAEVIARAVETGRLALAHVLSPARRELRLELSVRRTLVEMRAQLSATIRGLVRAAGERLVSCEPENLPKHVQKAALKESTRLRIVPLVTMLEQLNPQIDQVETKLEQLCAREPVVQRLCTAPGVGPVVAAAFVSVIDEAKRFGDAHQVQSYLGLVPSEDTSVRRRLGSISKAGNRYLRALLVQAAQCILRLRADDPLKRWAEGVEHRRGRRVAVVAVARRLCGILWAMWRYGTTYNPQQLGVASARGLSEHARALEHQATQVRLEVSATGNRRRPRTTPTHDFREGSLR